MRLPLALWGAEAIEREHEWIPRLTPLLPVDVPDLLGRGRPGSGYPCPWSVFGWVEGSHPEPDRLPHPYLLATDLAALVRAFHDIHLPNPPASYRGPVAEMDDAVRQCIAEVTTSSTRAA